MSKTDPDLDAYLDAAARLMSIDIDPAWYPAVRFHFSIILKHADFVAEFQLPDDADPAPVFEA